MNNNHMKMNLNKKNLDKIKVVSTFKSAFLDPFNWFMIVPISALALVSFTQVALFAKWIWLLLLGFSVWFLYHYINAILHREIEIDDKGIRYREGTMRSLFLWENVEQVTLEPSKGQITFQINGKSNRIHEFSLPKHERTLARQLIAEKAKAREIPVEDHAKIT